MGKIPKNNTVQKKEDSTNKIVKKNKAPHNIDDTDKTEVLNEMPSEIKHALEQLPKEQQKSFKSSISAVLSSTSNRHPLLEKVEPEHIHKILDYTHQDEQNSYKYACSNRFFRVGYVIIGLAFAAFLIIYLQPKDPQLFNDILKYVVGFLGGFGAGYGWKKYQQ